MSKTNNKFMIGVNELPEIVERNIDDLTLWEDNPRTIKEADFDRLIEQIKLLGVYKPLLINQDNIVLGGNMRTQALRKMGVKKTICSLVRTDNKAQMMEYALSDNDQIGVTDEQAVAEYITLNPSIRSELFAINSSPMKLVSTVLQELSPEVEEDEAPELSKDPPLSVLGATYQLGRHKVMCGSATDEDQVSTLFGPLTIDLYLTDPPYNVAYNDDSAANLKARRRRQDTLTLQNDKFESPEEFRAFLADSYRRADEHMKNGATFYIFHADAEGLNFRQAVVDVEWLLKQVLVWNKSHMVMGRQDYHWKHEPILYGWKSGKAHSWYSNRSQTTVLDYDRPGASPEHPTMKPINILAYLINNSSKAGDLVFDSFLGSGSTLIACEQTDRTCYGMELDPKYCDVIRKRYAKFVNNNELPDNWEELTPCLDV